VVGVGITLLAGILGVGLLKDASDCVEAGIKKSDSVVKVFATATDPDGKGKQLLSVVLLHDKGWHTYANPIGNDEFDNNKTVVTVFAKGKPIDATVEYPAGTLVNDPIIGKYLVYDNKVEIKVTVPLTQGDTSDLEVRVRILACHEKGACLPVAVVKALVR
jgi:hypothetical protein